MPALDSYLSLESFSKSEHARVHFVASMYQSATLIRLHLHDKGRRYCHGKWSSWSKNLENSSHQTAGMQAKLPGTCSGSYFIIGGFISQFCLGGFLLVFNWENDLILAGCLQGTIHANGKRLHFELRIRSEMRDFFFFWLKVLFCCFSFHFVVLCRDSLIKTAVHKRSLAPAVQLKAYWLTLQLRNKVFNRRRSDAK